MSQEVTLYERKNLVEAVGQKVCRRRHFVCLLWHLADLAPSLPNPFCCKRRPLHSILDSSASLPEADAFHRL